MNLADTVRMLGRRWYVTVPMLVLALAVAAAAFVVVKPTYERSASLLLLPDQSSIPEGGNPYLYLSGLNNVADVLTRAAASQEFLEEVTGSRQGNEVEIVPDAGTAGPVVSITASSVSDDQAGEMLEESVRHVTATLDDMQADEGLPADRRITVVPLASDTTGTVVQRPRITAAAISAVVGLLLAILVPAAVEGLSHRRRRRVSAAGGEPDDDPVVSREIRTPTTDADFSEPGLPEATDTGPSRTHGGESRKRPRSRAQSATRASSSETKHSDV